MKFTVKKNHDGHRLAAGELRLDLGGDVDRREPGPEDLGVKRLDHRRVDVEVLHAARVVLQEG